MQVGTSRHPDWGQFSRAHMLLLLATPENGARDETTTNAALRDNFDRKSEMEVRRVEAQAKLNRGGVKSYLLLKHPVQP